MTMTVTDDYHAGRWVPDYYGTRYVVANKDLRRAVRDPAHSVHGYEYPARTWYSERDTSVKYATLQEAQAECDRRNAEL